MGGQYAQVPASRGIAHTLLTSAGESFSLLIERRPRAGAGRCLAAALLPVPAPRGHRRAPTRWR